MPPTIEELIARTRARHVTADELELLARDLDAIGGPRAYAHAIFTRARALGLSYRFADELAMLDTVEPIFIEIGDTTALARVYFSRGWVFQTTGNYNAAPVWFHRSLELLKQVGDQAGIASNHTQLAMLFLTMGDYPASLVEFGHALRVYQDIGDLHGIAGSKTNLGNVHAAVNDLDRALEAFEESAVLHEANNDTMFLATALGNSALVHYRRQEFDRAVEYLRRVLALRIQLNVRVPILQTTGNLAETLLAAGHLDEARALLESIDMNESPDPIFHIDMMAARARILMIDNDLDAAHEQLLAAMYKATEYSIPSRRIDMHLALRNLAQQRNDLAAYVEHNNEYLKLTEQYAGSAAARQITTIEKEHELQQRTQELDQHRTVLHATLPKHIADRVVRGEQINDHVENAAVLFADIVGFTVHSSAMAAADVVGFLEQIFSSYDAICEQHGVTKVKTIGDSYMCFKGDGTAQQNASAIARAAGMMQSALFTWPSGAPLQVRIGLHIGPVTAGVIGTQRLQYDVWGDTVNVASRMESMGEPGRIHVSDAFAQSLRLQDLRPHDGNSSPFPVPSSQFPVPSSLISRGEMEIKGKGMMTTYWIDHVGR